MSQSTGRAKRSEKQFLTRDRRGHGRSSHPWDGNAMNTHADDLAALIQSLNLKDAILVGFSTGGGEVARYIGRHGTKRVAKAALVSSAVPPLMLKASNPGGLPIEVFEWHPRGIDCQSAAILQRSGEWAVVRLQPPRVEGFAGNGRLVPDAGNTRWAQECLRLHQGFFGNRFHGRPEELRYPNAGGSRR